MGTYCNCEVEIRVLTICKGKAALNIKVISADEREQCYEQKIALGIDEEAVIPLKVETKLNIGDNVLEEKRVMVYDQYGHDIENCGIKGGR